MSGCGTKSQEIDFIVGFNNVNTGFSQDLKSIVNAFEEWDNLRGDTAQFTELDAKYNEQFFTAKSLLVYSFARNYSGGQTEITKVSKKGKEIVIDLIHNDGDMASVAHFIVIIEVKKADIAGANSLRIASN